jgi:hypothetical protein
MTKPRKQLIVIEDTATITPLSAASAALFFAGKKVANGLSTADCG